MSENRMGTMIQTAPQYWIVDYRVRTIEVFVLEEGAYALVGKGDRSKVLVGFEVAVEEVV